MTQNSFRRAAVSLLTLLIVTASHLASAQNNQLRPNSTPRFAANESNRIDQPLSVPRTPFPPLSREHQAYIDKLLEIWEDSSRQIDRYRCKFTAWEFDPVFLRPDQNGKVPAKTIAEGEIKFYAPDKGRYEVKQIYRWTPPKKPGEKPQYLPGTERDLEQWVCDGKSVYIVDYPRQRVVERELPPEMRGRAIVDGPLPFLFGIEAEKLKRRYWLRVITPPGAKDEFWLEVWPKRRDDASSYKKLEVILSREPFLPKALQVFPVNYDEKTRPISTVYEFRDQEINFFDVKRDLPLIKRFFRSFDPPSTPSGWEYEKLDWRKAGNAKQAVPSTTNNLNNARRTGGGIRFPR